MAGGIRVYQCHGIFCFHLVCRCNYSKQLSSRTIQYVMLPRKRYRSFTKDPSKNPSKPGRAEIAKAVQTISVTFLQPKQRPLQDSLLIYDPFHTAPWSRSLRQIKIRRHLRLGKLIEVVYPLWNFKRVRRYAHCYVSDSDLSIRIMPSCFWIEQLFTRLFAAFRQSVIGKTLADCSHWFNWR